MKKRVYIVHGWGGDPESNWFPWTKMELEKHGFEVVAAQMPNADFPKQREWISYLHELTGEVDENTYMIGHSLGGIAILRFLESLPENKMIGGAVLVAGFSESLRTIPEIENFFEKPVDFEKVKSACKNFVAINSDNDPYVSLGKGEMLRDKLAAKLIILQNAGHINMGTGYFQLPIVVEELLKIQDK